MVSANQVQRALYKEVPQDSTAATNLVAAVLHLIATFGAWWLLVFVLGDEFLDWGGVWRWTLGIWACCLLCGHFFEDAIEEVDDDDTRGSLVFFLSGPTRSLKALVGRGPKQEPALPSLATPILTFLVNNPQKVCSSTQIYEILRDGGLAVGQRDFHQALQWLKQRGWLLGDDPQGYYYNSRRRPES